MMINVGGLIGPVLASELRETSWNYIFVMSAGAILVNLLIVLFFFKEPEREKNTDPLGKSLRIVFENIFKVLKDVKFTIFLLIIIGSWTVFWQFFYSLPVFISQWTDTRALYDAIYGFWPGFAEAIGTDNGRILAEKLIALDAFFIVIFQVVISTVVARFRPLHAMTAGIIINTLGLTLSVLTRNPFFLLLGIFIFAIGEMMFSPKILEYIGRIAPKDRAALYMGTQFLPIAIGNFIGGFISGGVYERMADKVIMARDLLPEKADISLTQEEVLYRAMEVTGLSEEGLTEMLWNANNPGSFGFVLAAMGGFTFILLLLYDRFIFKR
jgi:dipeptide/tripeptide permease